VNHETKKQLDRHRSAVSRSSNSTKSSRCFLEQDTLSSMFSTGWFQELIRVWFTLAKMHLSQSN